ncbi:hypothetical protein QGQ84_15775 [Bacillus safensis]|nr:hypothetical protein [Bacillus safensis]MDI0275043.1 hypothetical protein [Bacillus safensis]
MKIVIYVMDLGAFIICILMFIALWFEEAEEADNYVGFFFIA